MTETKEFPGEVVLGKVDPQRLFILDDTGIVARIDDDGSVRLAARVVEDIRKGNTKEYASLAQAVAHALASPQALSKLEQRMKLDLGWSGTEVRAWLGIALEIDR